ncbi:MAG: mechanosensitive ion channel domain-containing protein [Planctomycetales bacterium]
MATLEVRIKRIRESKEFSAALRDEAIETLTSAIDQYRAAADFAEQRARWEREETQAPGELERVQEELARLGSTPRPAEQSAATTGKSLIQLQQALTRAESDRDHLRSEYDELTDRLESRADRRREMAERDAQIAEELPRLEAALDRESEDHERDVLQEALQSLRQAQRQALLQEQELLRQEALTMEATGELLAVQRDLAAMRWQRSDEVVDLWQSLVNTVRRSEAERDLAQAQARAANAPAGLRPLAQVNVELALQRRDIATRIEETISEAEQVATRLTELEEQFEKVTERARKIGFTEAIGLLLRKQRDALPADEEAARNRRARAVDLAQWNVQLTDFEERRAQLADVPSRVRTELKSVRGRSPSAQLAVLEREATELLESQRHCLDALIRDTTRYVDEQMALETVERQLAQCVREFSAFSDQHILWIRSAEVPGRDDARRAGQAAQELVLPAGWQGVVNTLRNDFAAQRPLYALVGLLAAALWITGIWRRSRGAATGQISHAGFGGVELLRLGARAAWLPLLAAFVGTRLASAPGAGAFAAMVGSALYRLAPLWLLARWFELKGWRSESIGSRPSSPGGTPFAKPLQLIALHLLLPLAFVVLLTESQASEAVRNSLGRLAFVTLMLLAAWLLRQWCPANRFRGAGDAHRSTTSAGRTWHWLLIAAPLGLAAASLAGYHYTAVHLAGRVVLTGGLAAAIFALQTLAVRGTHRVMGTSPALATAPTDVSGIGWAPVPAEATEEPAEALELRWLLAVQSQRMIRLVGILVLWGGAAWIWSGVVPAQRIVQSVELWPRPLHWIDVPLAEDEAGKIVTLGGALAALAIALVTLAAARNVRGALELTVFRRVTLDAGARYAVSAVCRYVIGVAGLFGACSFVGIGWAQLNWLVAAMTVGLGFGLQEIFANFISGLILLFERPVRIGDMVSVEGTTGTVSRIRIRATTITDGDMRELIVPNKELITGRVINWTLSNTVARMTIVVRTAHGVDPDKARGLLLSAALQHPLVLREPPPQALFDEFTDKTQNFTLRVYMGSCDVYTQLRHELLTAIQRSFRQAGIGLNASDAATFPVPVPAPVASSPVPTSPSPRAA